MNRALAMQIKAPEIKTQVTGETPWGREIQAYSAGKPPRYPVTIMIFASSGVRSHSSDASGRVFPARTVSRATAPGGMATEAADEPEIRYAMNALRSGW